MKHILSGALFAGALALAVHEGQELGAPHNIKPHPKKAALIRHHTAKKIAQTLTESIPQIKKDNIREEPSFEAIGKMSNKTILEKQGYTEEQIASFSEALQKKIASEYRLAHAHTISEIKNTIGILNPEVGDIVRDLRKTNIENINSNDESDAMNELLLALSEKHYGFSQDTSVDVDKLRSIAEDEISLEYLSNLKEEFTSQMQRATLDRWGKKLRTPKDKTLSGNETITTPALIDTISYSDLGILILELAEKALPIDKNATDKEQKKIYQAWFYLNSLYIQEPHQK